MAQLKSVQELIPTADSVAGRVIAYHEGKHYDLGEYVGDGVVVLNTAGEALVGQLTIERVEVVIEVPPAPEVQPPVVSKAKATRKAAQPVAPDVQIPGDLDDRLAGI